MAKTELKTSSRVQNQQPTNVLILEDEKLFAETLKDLLESAGYRPTVTSRTADAIAKLESIRFDCVLVDMHLNGESGERVIKHLRNNVGSLNAGTSILVISGGLEVEIIKRIGKSINGALVKPFPMGELLQRVGELSFVCQAFREHA